MQGAIGHSVSLVSSSCIQYISWFCLSAFFFAATPGLLDAFGGELLEITRTSVLHTWCPTNIKTNNLLFNGCIPSDPVLTNPPRFPSFISPIDSQLFLKFWNLLGIYHKMVSYDQLWAAMLIGQNAITWCWPLYKWCTVASGWNVITRAALSWWHVNLRTTYVNVPLATVHHLYNGLNKHTTNQRTEHRRGYC